MRKAKASDVSTERKNWGKIFNGMVHMLRSQQQQLLTLAGERKLLEDRIRMLHDGWESDIRLYKDQISEMKGTLIFEEKRRLLDGTKADLLLGLKQREVSILNYISEHQEDELADFKAWAEFLSQRLSAAEEQGKICEGTGKGKKGTTDSGSKSIRRRSNRNMPQEENCSNQLEAELRRLKREYEVAMGNNSKASALSTEKEFVWNQYKIMENEYVNKLRSKHRELDQANEKIEKLLSSMEQLQSAKDEKDEAIAQLESKVGNMEEERKNLNKKLSKILEELEALRKFRNAQVTPILNPCTAKSKGSGLGCNSRRSSSRFKKELSVPKATDPATSSGKDNKSFKRKRGPVFPDSSTPKLFSSDFKVPKLKSLSPNVG